MESEEPKKCSCNPALTADKCECPVDCTCGCKKPKEGEEPKEA
jgi:hypothetical protein